MPGSYDCFALSQSMSPGVAEQTPHRIRWSSAASRACLWLRAELVRSRFLLWSRGHGHPAVCHPVTLAGSCSRGAAVSRCHPGRLPELPLEMTASPWLLQVPSGTRLCPGEPEADITHSIFPQRGKLHFTDLHCSSYLPNDFDIA